jgi:hypothetical protein
MPTSEMEVNGERLTVTTAKEFWMHLAPDTRIYARAIRGKTEDSPIGPVAGQLKTHIQSALASDHIKTGETLLVVFS